MVEKVVAVVKIHKPLEALSDDLNIIKDIAEKFIAAQKLVVSMTVQSGGEVIGLIDGCEVITIPVENLENIKELHQRIKDELNMAVSIGVGEDSEQANCAVKYADENDPGSIKVYRKEMENKAQGEEIMQKSEGLSPDDREKLIATLQNLNQNKNLIAQLKQANPDIYAGIVETVKSLANIVQFDKQAHDKRLVATLADLNDQIKSDREKKEQRLIKEIERRAKKHQKHHEKKDREKDLAELKRINEMRSRRRKFLRENPDIVTLSMNTKRKE